MVIYLSPSRSGPETGFVAILLFLSLLYCLSNNELRRLASYYATSNFYVHFSRLQAKKKIMKNYVTGKAHEKHRPTSVFRHGSSRPIIYTLGAMAMAICHPLGQELVALPLRGLFWLMCALVSMPPRTPAMRSVLCLAPACPVGAR